MLKFLTLCISGVMLGCIYGLIALGYGLIYKVSGLMSFVQGDMLTLGAFLGLTFYSHHRPAVLAFAAAYNALRICLRHAAGKRRHPPPAQ